jgi:hypothetical protein
MIEIREREQDDDEAGIRETEYRSEKRIDNTQKRLERLKCENRREICPTSRPMTGAATTPPAKVLAASSGVLLIGETA